jgi:hypothetical protein
VFIQQSKALCVQRAKKTTLEKIFYTESNQSAVVRHYNFSSDAHHDTVIAAIVVVVVVVEEPEGERERWFTMA